MSANCLMFKACERAAEVDELSLNMCISVVDATKYKLYVKNFSEFFTNQIEHAKTIIQRRNPAANVITTPWEKLAGKRIVAVAESDTIV